MSNDNIELKDVIHLYFGCEVNCGDQIETLVGIEINGDGLLTIETRFRGNLINYYYEHEGFGDLKLRLRKLDSMTAEDIVNLFLLKGLDYSKDFTRTSITDPRQFTYLLSIGIDLFGLIEKGLAIDKNAKP